MVPSCNRGLPLFLMLTYIVLIIPLWGRTMISKNNILNLNCERCSFEPCPELHAFAKVALVVSKKILFITY